MRDVDCSVCSSLTGRLIEHHIKWTVAASGIGNNVPACFMRFHILLLPLERWGVATVYAKAYLWCMCVWHSSAYFISISSLGMNEYFVCFSSFTSKMVFLFSWFDKSFSFETRHLNSEKVKMLLCLVFVGRGAKNSQIKRLCLWFLA